MTPFETYFHKKSCLDFLAEAREYLADESMRVSKTPAGFNRPRDASRKALLPKKSTDEITKPKSRESQNLNFLARNGTKRLDSTDGKAKIKI